MSKSRIFVISLPRARERRLNVLAQLLPTGWTFEMVDAVDGLAVKPEQLKIVAHAWDLSVAQAACYRSHIGILQRICDYDLDHAIILEDDCVLKEADGLSLSNVLEHLPPGADHVQLHNLKHAYDGWKILEEGPLFNRVGPTNIGTWGYVISRRLAEYVLTHHAEPAYPIDHLFIQLSRKKALPFGFYETRGCLVDILNDTSFINGAPRATRDWTSDLRNLWGRMFK